MASRPKSIVALEWRTGRLRAVEASAASGTVRIHRVLQRDLEPALVTGAAGELGEVLGAYLREAGFRTTHAAVAVHRQDVLIRSFTVPPSKHRGELSEMVRLQAANQLPVEEGTAELDFIEEGVDEAGMLRVKVAAGYTEQLGRLRQTLTAAGLRCAALPLRPGMILPLMTAPQIAGEPILLAEIDHDWSQLSLVADGRIVLSRDLPRGYLSGKPTVDENGRLPSLFDEDRAEFLRQTMAPLAAEMRATLNAFNAESKADLPTRLIVTGELADHEDLRGTLGDLLELEVAPLNPWDRVRASSRVVDQAERSAAFVGVLALAAGVLTGSRTLDFANPALVSRPRAQVRPWQVLAGVALCGLAVLVGLAVTNLSGAQERLGRRRIALRVLKKKNRELKSVKAALARMADWQRPAPAPLEVLRELAALLPDAKQAYVEQCIFESADRLKLTVRFDQRATWNKLFADIGRSSVLRIADKPSTMRPDNVPDKREHPYPVRYTFYLLVDAEGGSALATSRGGAAVGDAGSDATEPGKEGA